MNDKIADRIYDYLERIGNLIRMDARRAEPFKGLQPVQLEALHYIGSCNRYSNTPIAVAEYLGLTKGTVSQTLSVLEGHGLIEKVPDLHDRRVVRLLLTQSGSDLLREAIPPRVLRSAMKLLSERLSEEAVEVLHVTLQAMQQANHLRSFGLCKSCRHHRREQDGSRSCGLTREALYPTDAEKICREHDFPDAA